MIDIGQLFLRFDGDGVILIGGGGDEIRNGLHGMNESLIENQTQHFQGAETNGFVRGMEATVDFLDVDLDDGGGHSGLNVVHLLQRVGAVGGVLLLHAGLLGEQFLLEFLLVGALFLRLSILFLLQVGLHVAQHLQLAADQFFSGFRQETRVQIADLVWVLDI